mgnify:CR=1 FL=1
MNLKAIRSVAEFKENEQAWRALYENSQSRTPFLSYDWLLTTLETSKNVVAIHFMVIEAGGKFLSAFPLLIENKKYIAVTKMVLRHANYSKSDFCDFLCGEGISLKGALKLYFKYINELDYDILHVDNINSSSNSMNLFMKSIYNNNLFFGKYINVTNPVLKYTPNGDIDKKESKKIAKRLADLSKQYNVEVVIGGEFNKEIFECLRAFHYSSFPGVGFNTPENQSFYIDMISRKDFDEGILDFSYILVDGKCVACHFGFKDEGKGVLYYYVPSYDSNYNKYGVGKVLLLSMIEHYKEKNYVLFDFLRGAEAYKTVWATNEYQNISIFGCKEKSGYFNKTIVLTWLAMKSIQNLFKVRD